MIINEMRGEVAININGTGHKLCLTLGALAELESAFAAKDLADLGRKMAQLNASDILLVLLILLKGGARECGNGECGAEWGLEALKNSDLNPKIAAQKIAECFEKCA